MSRSQKTVALIATLDTKGREAKFVRDELLAKGKKVILIDSGILGEATEVEPDFRRDEVAACAGMTIDEIRRSGSRAEAVKRMSEGVRTLLLRLLGGRAIDGVMCIAGAGSMIALPGMHGLPLGFPKLLLCPLLSGERVFEPFVRTSDIVLMHSVVDILGVNPISRTVFRNAASAMSGMVDGGGSQEETAARSVAVTMFGQTTPGVMAAKAHLEAAGYSCVIFHANGVGGRCMEDLIEQGHFVGVLDYTLSEVAGQELGGLNKSTPQRLEVAGRHGLPQVIVPGCIDFLDVFPSAMHRQAYSHRKMYPHSPDMYLVRVEEQEMARLGEVVARKLSSARGPVEVIFPCRGLSRANAEGEALYDTAADQAFLRQLREHAGPHVCIIEKQAHVNDPEFAVFAAQRLLRLMEAEPTMPGIRASSCP